ncbi:MAG: SPASM domain-containing protein, partial [Acidobacteria bacterium]|nr:SPASM domain-containing protein [Acidobacteriota bacterium]
DVLCPSCLTREKSTGSTGVPFPDFKKYLFSLSANEGKKFLSVINIIPLIQAVMSSTKIHSGCRAGLNYIAVSAQGDMYPCHKMMGNDFFKLGNISDGLNPARRKQLCFQVENKEKCGHCGIRYLCGGGPALNANGLTPQECQLQKEMAEYAMFLFQQMDLKQKSRINGVAHRIREIMPYRCCAREKISPVNMIRHLTVQGTSMRPILEEGDRVMVHPTSNEKIKTGDIVCFGKPATCHRLIWKYRKKNRWYGIEKGDGQMQGSIIPLEEINGKVISIQKQTYSINLNMKRWQFFNKLTATFSLIIHTGSLIFNISGRRKKTKWRNH